MSLNKDCERKEMQTGVLQKSIPFSKSFQRALLCLGIITGPVFIGLAPRAAFCFWSVGGRGRGELARPGKKFLSVIKGCGIYQHEFSIYRI